MGRNTQGLATEAVGDGLIPKEQGTGGPWIRVVCLGLSGLAQCPGLAIKSPKEWRCANVGHGLEETGEES